MKNTCRFLIITTISLFGASSLSFAQESEKVVRLRTAEGNCVVIGGGGKTILGGPSRNSSRELFTIIDANGGELADGDEVKIRYTAGTKADGESSKPSFWQVEGANFARRGKASSFKIKKVNDRYAFQTADGKFVGVASGGKDLAIVDTQDAALKVELVAAAAVAPATATNGPKDE